MKLSFNAVFTRTLVAPAMQVTNGASVTFDYWSTQVSNTSLALPITSESYTVTAYYSAELNNNANNIRISLLLLFVTLLFCL